MFFVPKNATPINSFPDWSFPGYIVSDPPIGPGIGGFGFTKPFHRLTMRLRVL